MSRSYAIADLHVGHKNIVKFRPKFNTVKEHDEYVLESIVSTCGKRDSLYILGDCFFSVESIDYLRIMKKEIGHIHIVLGNHDTENKQKRDILSTILKEGLVNSVHGLLKYSGCWLSHAPIHDSELRGNFCVHGHTHSVVIDDPRYFGVSCEQIDYQPINFQRVKEILTERNNL